MAQQNITLFTNHPGHLMMGPHEALVARVIESLQQIFCMHNACHVCHTCRAIQDYQYHAVHWLSTPSTYTREQVNIIHESMRFALDQDQHVFFIIQHADRLAHASANSLLKLLEEPPQGYHFILISERVDQILPTIRSRCIMHTYGDVQARDTKHPLLSLFVAESYEPLTFMGALEKADPNEQETAQLLDQLLMHWLHEYKKTIVQDNTQRIAHIEHMVTIVKEALASPPMPGGSKLFWKNLFLTCNMKH